MNLNQLYYFVAVCDRKSFSKAAADIFVTQPTLSKQIAALEAELGMKLIDRQKSGRFRLTPGGEAFLESFRRILREYEEAAEVARSLEQRKKRCRMGVMEAWGLQTLIRDCSAMVEARFPNVKLELEFLPPGKLNERLRTDQLDIVLYTEGVYSPVDGYTREKLTDIACMIFVAADWAEKLENIQKEEFFCYPMTELNNVNSQSMYRFLGRRNLLIEERESVQSIKMEVLAGRGFGMTDAWSEVAHDPRFALRTLPGVWREVIVSRRTLDDSECTAALLDCIRNWAAASKF